MKIFAEFQMTVESERSKMEKIVRKNFPKAVVRCEITKYEKHKVDGGLPSGVVAFVSVEPLQGLLGMPSNEFFIYFGISGFGGEKRYYVDTEQRLITNIIVVQDMHWSEEGKSDPVRFNVRQSVGTADEVLAKLETECSNVKKLIKTKLAKFPDSLRSEIEQKIL